MPSKKYITVGTRVSETEFDELSKIANAENISISAIMKLCIQGVNNGEIVIEKGELKTCVDTHNDAVFEDFKPNIFGEKVEKRFDRLRERSYPEAYINSMKEDILRGIDSRIDMLPKKFDARRMRSLDEGC